MLSPRDTDNFNRYQLLVKNLTGIGAKYLKEHQEKKSPETTKPSLLTKFTSLFKPDLHTNQEAATILANLESHLEKSNIHETLKDNYNEARKLLLLQVQASFQQIKKHPNRESSLVENTLEKIYVSGIFYDVPNANDLLYELKSCKTASSALPCIQKLFDAIVSLEMEKKQTPEIKN